MTTFDTVPRRVPTVTALPLAELVRRVVAELPPDGRYVLFGCGSYGKTVMSALRERRLSVTRCFDNRRELWGRRFEGAPVEAPGYRGDEDVIIATQFAREVKEQLLDLGYRVDRLVAFDGGLVSPDDRRRALEVLARLPEQRRNGTGILLHRFFSWSDRLYQRPQQMARALGEVGATYFYTATGADDVPGIAVVSPGCYITQCPELFDEWPGRRVYHYYSTDHGIPETQVHRALEAGHVVLYEYVDAVSETITGPIPERARHVHERMLDDERVKVVATAEQLAEDVRRHRARNYRLITNGVDLRHFRRSAGAGTAPGGSTSARAQRRPTICYYGALAQWLDYGLLRALARARPDLDILLIGVDYDGSVRSSGLDRHSNVHVLPPIPYEELPQQVSRADVFMVPFQLNEVTHCTSPIKLFEYMAMGKPIVTTAMRECTRYASVLVARDEDDFIRQVSIAETLGTNPVYQSTQRREADENAWTRKAVDLLEFLEAPL